MSEQAPGPAWWSSVLVRRWLPVVVVVVAAWVWWCSATSTASARISALQTTDASAFAVHEQLVGNFARFHRFFQTIHTGYDDAWTWSGHRAPILVITSLLYGLDPSPWTLSKVMLAGMLLGVIPASLAGRAAARADWGVAVGGLLYLMSPPLMAIGLQDYQDLSFALPCLVFFMWAVRSSRAWLVALGALVAILPREECVPAALAIAVLYVPLMDPPTGEAGDSSSLLSRVDKRRWARNVGVTVALLGLYSAWAVWAFPIEAASATGGAASGASSHDMPLASALMDMIHGEPVPLVGKYFPSFYLLLVAPLGLLALLSPGDAVVALGLVLLHMTVLVGHGVDRSWSMHSHHLAPVVAFVVMGSIRGTATLLRWLAGRPDGAWLAGRAGGALFLWSVAVYVRWLFQFNVVVAVAPTAPTFIHPVWGLVALLPEDAVPIVPTDVSIIASKWSRSYTYDESLGDKAPGQGFAAGTHLIADLRDVDVIERCLYMQGAKVVAQTATHLLLTWPPGVVDPAPPSGWQQPRPGRSVFTGSYAISEQIPGVAPHEPQVALPDEALVPWMRRSWVGPSPFDAVGQQPAGNAPQH